MIFQGVGAMAKMTLLELKEMDLKLWEVLGCSVIDSTCTLSYTSDFWLLATMSKVFMGLPMKDTA